jgi:nucleoside diphosphate kinase
MGQTFLLVMPDFVQRNMVGEIISRYEHLGLKLIFIKMIKLGENIEDLTEYDDEVIYFIFILLLM